MEAGMLRLWRLLGGLTEDYRMPAQVMAGSGEEILNKWLSSTEHLRFLFLYAQYCLRSVSRLAWQGYTTPSANYQCQMSLSLQMNMFRRNGPASLSHSFSMFQPGSLVTPSPDPGPGSSASLNNTHKPPLFTSSCNSISEEDKESWSWHWTVTGCHLGTWEMRMIVTKSVILKCQSRVSGWGWVSEEASIKKGINAKVTRGF